MPRLEITEVKPRSAPLVSGHLSISDWRNDRKSEQGSFARGTRSLRDFAIQSTQSRRTSRLRVGLMTPTLLMGGAERWMISLARCCDPRLIEWTGTALTDQAPASVRLCREMSAFMPIHAGPFATGGVCIPSIHYCNSARAALEAVARSADLLITWGVRHLAKLIDGFQIPVVFVSHGGGEWSVETLKTSESGATHFVAVSETARLPFSAEVRDRATIIHNGVDVHRCTGTTSRHRVRAEWGFDDHHRLVGYVGRYSWEKRPEAAAEIVRHLGGDYRAVYAGEGWAEAQLRQHVQRIAGVRARFVPMDPNTGNLLSAIDAFVLASPAEGFSLSLAEAWYCGVPIIATPVGAVPELEQRHGRLVARVPIGASPREMAGAVQLALTPDYREEVVVRAREMVCSHYTATSMTERWTDYLFSIC